MKAGTHIGPVVDESQLKQDMDYIEIGRKEGREARLRRRAAEPRNARLLSAAGAVHRSDQRHAHQPARKFSGRSRRSSACKDYDEALHVANDTPFGLSSGICTTSLKHATHYKRNAEAGMVMVNLPTAGVDFHVPFGGRKGRATARANRAVTPPNFHATVKTAYTLA